MVSIQHSAFSFPLSASRQRLFFRVLPLLPCIPWLKVAKPEHARSIRSRAITARMLHRLHTSFHLVNPVVLSSFFSVVEKTSTTDQEEQERTRCKNRNHRNRPKNESIARAIRDRRTHERRRTADAAFGAVVAVAKRGRHTRPDRSQFRPNPVSIPSHSRPDPKSETDLRRAPPDRSLWASPRHSRSFTD